MTKLVALIGDAGPISVATLMSAALGDPEHGYYLKQEPFVAKGDFVTAPEVSQMFGELIGLWLGTLWQLLGRPPQPVLAELGPGRGTLMADALRALAKVPGFPVQGPVHLVETSPRLRALQARTLEGRARHYDQIEALPDDGPLLLVANEFFDALPIRQWIHRMGRWHERLVGLDDQGALTFGLAPDPAVLPAAPTEPPTDGAVFEFSPVGITVAGELGRRLASQGGGALVIDYGSAHGGFANTLQAVKRHHHAPILETLGEADLTAHVNFTHLAAAARAAGATAAGPIAQGEFLEHLGIGLRAAHLANAAPARRAEIESQHQRLTSQGEMGSLFKVLALASPTLPPLPAFDHRPRLIG